MWRYLKYMYSSPKKCIVRAKNAYVKVWDQGYIWKPKCWVKLFALKSQFMWMWMWPWWTKILNKPDTKTVECFSSKTIQWRCDFGVFHNLQHTWNHYFHGQFGLEKLSITEILFLLKVACMMQKKTQLNVVSAQIIQWRCDFDCSITCNILHLKNLKSDIWNHVQGKFGLENLSIVDWIFLVF